jgi:hypothetical protein
VSRIGDGVYGAVLTFSLLGVSGVVCSLILAHVHTLGWRGILLYGGWSLLGLATLLVGIAPSYPLIALSGVLVGIAFGSETIWATPVQQRVPSEYMSRVVSLDMLGSYALRPVGLAGAGVVASAVGVRPVLIVGGSIAFLILALGAFLLAIRQLD